MESIRPIMSGCTETGKPLVSILMAVYEPRMDWLREQLLSLNAQTYPNLRLYIRDDCSPTVPYEEIQSCVQDCISAFPCTIQRNEKNLGSNGTFELLTREAEGDYFAYCDQDDRWLPEKLSILQKSIEERQALLACSDMRVIDQAGHKIADSITQVRRHHIFYRGKDCAPKLLVKNFVTGCTMLVDSRAAKNCVPFCPYMVHDHYIALCCAEWGMIYSCPESLIEYRIHGGNQTGVLAGVKDRESYGRIRIDLAVEKFHWLMQFFHCSEETKQEIRKRMIWMESRQDNWRKRKKRWTALRYCAYSPIPTLFELLIVYLPDFVFDWCIQQGKENKI